MKIIIKEEQLKKNPKAIKALVDEVGLDAAIDMLGLSRMRLAQLTNIPIKGDTFFDKNEVVVGQLLKDLVAIDNVYNECDLIYDTMSRSIHWVCRFDEANQKIKTLTYATPYYNDNDMTPVETNEFEVIKDGESEDYGGMSNEYSTVIDSPTKFNNVDELISWFENEYKPVVYKAIKRHLKEFKEEYRKTIRTFKR
jgi:hypothetical protein